MVEVKFRRPAGVPLNPSAKMTESLRLLSECDEMQPLITKALEKSKRVVVEVFHRSDGTPILIHAAVTPEY